MIQFLTGADYHAVHACFSLSYQPIWSLESTRDTLESETTLAIGWREAEKLLGFTLLQVVEDEAEMLMLACVPEARRKGVAKALWNAAHAACLNAGIKTLHLEVEKNNAPAIAFYHAMGFTLSGERRNYYRTETGRSDALLMRFEFIGGVYGPK